MDKHRIKYEKTAEKMNMALISLMKKRSFDEISIKLLCEHAEVNRSTFYYHYQNLTELLEDTKNYIIRIFIDQLKFYTVTLEDYCQMPEWLVKEYLEIFKEYRDIFIISDFRPNCYRHKREYQLMFEQIAIPICSQKGIANPSTVKYLMEYYNAGCQEVILQWLEGGCEEKVEDICDIIRLCILGLDSIEKYNENNILTYK